MSPRYRCGSPRWYTYPFSCKGVVSLCATKWKLWNLVDMETPLFVFSPCQSWNPMPAPIAFAVGAGARVVGGRYRLRWLYWPLPWRSLCYVEVRVNGSRTNPEPTIPKNQTRSFASVTPPCLNLSLACSWCSPIQHSRPTIKVLPDPCISLCSPRTHVMPWLLPTSD